MKKILVRVNNPSTLSYMEREYKNPSFAGSVATENYLAVRKAVLPVLKDKFSAKEISAFIDVLNGTMYEPNQLINYNLIEHNFSDGCDLEGLDQKWQIDKDSTVNKLLALSIPERIVLTEWVRNFWESNWEQMSPEEYCNGGKK